MLDFQTGGRMTQKKPGAVKLTHNQLWFLSNNKRTNIYLPNSSCMDLIFTSGPDMVRESGVHLPLHPNCPH